MPNISTAGFYHPFEYCEIEEYLVYMTSSRAKGHSTREHLIMKKLDGKESESKRDRDREINREGIAGGS